MADPLPRESAPSFRFSVIFAALDPYRGYGTALATTLPAAIRVLDAFHCVKLANQVVDEVHRRVQTGHPGPPS